MTLKILGTGSFLPELSVSNDRLSEIMDTSDEWIRSRTGIEERHIAVTETTTSMAVEAAKRAIENAGISAEELDLIIVASVSTDHHYPSTACEVQSALSAKNAVAFDINAACSGFLFGLGIAKAYFTSGIYEKALIIGAETLSKMMDWDDRSTCVLFGDGAGAAVVEKAETGMISMVQGSDGAKGMVLNCKNRAVNNPFVKEYRNANPEKTEENSTLSELDYTHMEGQEVYKFAVRTVPKAIDEVLEKAGVSADEVKYFVLHQANIRIIEGVAKRLGQPMQKFPTNLQKCGNISAGSVPILLDMINREGKLNRGDKIVLAGFGAGLTWGAALLSW